MKNAQEMRVCVKIFFLFDIENETNLQRHKVMLFLSIITYAHNL